MAIRHHFTPPVNGSGARPPSVPTQPPDPLDGVLRAIIASPAADAAVRRWAEGLLADPLTDDDLPRLCPECGAAFVVFDMGDHTEAVCSDCPWSLTVPAEGGER